MFAKDKLCAIACADGISSAGTVEHPCSASIGVVVFLDAEVNHDEALKWADAAM